MGGKFGGKKKYFCEGKEEDIHVED